MVAQIAYGSQTRTIKGAEVLIATDYVCTPWLVGLSRAARLSSRLEPSAKLRSSLFDRPGNIPLGQRILDGSDQA